MEKLFLWFEQGGGPVFLASCAWGAAGYARQSADDCERRRNEAAKYWEDCVRRYVCFAFAALLAASPAMAAGAGTPEEKAATLRSLATGIGRTLGAASACPSIARTRIDAMAAKFTGMIKFYAPDEDEAAGFTELFKKSQTTGARLVATNQIDCISAELQLVGLENSSRTEAPEGGSVMPARLSDNPAQEAAPAVRGVTANEIRFGTSAPFSGANKIYGQQIKGRHRNCLPRRQRRRRCVRAHADPCHP